MGQQEYDDLETKDPDVYYMTHGEKDDDSGIITSDLLKQSYYTQKEVINIIKDVVNQLCTKIIYNLIILVAQKQRNQKIRLLIMMVLYILQKVQISIL